MAESNRRGRTIGLVGGIGAGKSSVASAMIERGGWLISADPLGHEALEVPSIKERIREVWGRRGVFTAEDRVDRKKLGAIVFPSPVERSRLEHLVHPYIETRIAEEVELGHASNRPFIVVDAAIMLEAGWNELCDRIVYVHAPRAQRVDRVQKSRGWTEKELSDRETVQWPLERKLAAAEAVIDNGGSARRTELQVEWLLREWGLIA